MADNKPSYMDGYAAGQLERYVLRSVGADSPVEAWEAKDANGSLDECSRAGNLGYRVQRSGNRP